jgi:hypothetical protein
MGGDIRPNVWQRKVQFTKTDEDLVHLASGLPAWALHDDRLSEKVTIAMAADKYDWTDEGLLLTSTQEMRFMKHKSIDLWIAFSRGHPELANL